MITLDSDTQLPRGTAHRMVGTLAHPLNQAIIDPEKNIVVAGYGILQPRVGVSVQSTAAPAWPRYIQAKPASISTPERFPMPIRISYREGIFTGKGIYEVDTVRRVLDRRFP